MLIVEHILRDIIAQMPTINVNGLDSNVKFHWGSERELNAYLKLNKENSYPLIWLTPSPETHQEANDRRVERNCTFIIAQREETKDLFNDERYIYNFDLVLNPITYWLQQGLTNSGATRLITPRFEVYKLPNYSQSETSKTKNGTIELWDAVRVRCNVEFNNFCINTISWLNLTT